MEHGTTIVALVGYFALMIGISLWYARRVKNNEDFVVAGRSLSRLILTGTLLATWTGAGTIIGRANFSYTYGPLASVFYSMGAPLGIAIMYFFLAERIRRIGKVTVPEIIEMRYGRNVRIFAAGAIVLAYVAIASEQVRALGYVMHLAAGVPEIYGELVGLTLILLTAALGGILSVAYTDAISAALIALGLFGALVFTLVAVGGFSGLTEALPAEKLSWTGGMTAFQMLGFVLPTLLLFMGDQNMYQRFGSATDPKTAKRAAGGFFFGDVFFYAAVALLASGAAVLLPGLGNPDLAILRLATDELPAVLGVAMIVAATAFIITTGNSYLLSTSTNLVNDIYASLTRKEHTSAQFMWMTRCTIVVVGIAAYVTGKLFPTVLEIQLFAYTMYGAVITPCLLAVFVSKRVTPAGAVASMAVGIVATIFWEFGLGTPNDWNSVLFSLPLAVVTLIVVSAFSKPLQPDHEPQAIKDPVRTG
jgi:SSS family solute:Na+ symporter